MNASSHSQVWRNAATAAHRIAAAPATSASGLAVPLDSRRAVAALACAGSPAARFMGADPTTRLGRPARRRIAGGSHVAPAHAPGPDRVTLPSGPIPVFSAANAQLD